VTPQIDHLGHACIRYAHGGVTLTTDPWFYPAFLGGWFPYPDNRGHLATALDSDYIYISHSHEDHLDREFLRQVDITRTSVIVPRFRSRYLEREVEKITGLPPIVLAHGQSTTLPTGIGLTMLTDRSHKEDSALLVEADGFRFLDSNDCELAISDWPGGIDLLASQFSGATWYPQCYDFDDETMLRKTQEVRKSNFERLCRRVEQTQARMYLPSAGPAAFLAPDIMQFNRHGGIFASWEEVAGQFAREFPHVAIWPYFNPYCDLKGYSRRRRAEWGAYWDMPDAFVTEEELQAHFKTLQSRNKRFLRDWRKDIGITSSNWIAGSERRWTVRLGLVAGELEESPSPEYFMDVPPRVLRALVDGRITWETALISHRVKLARTPDVYDNTLMGLLSFGDRPVQTLTMARQRASGEMTRKGGCEFQRWCPHAGEDLNFATIENRVITCPRHGWSWNADTGDNIHGGGVPLRVGKRAE
jgi:UDP-MurNAc hydroxylase